MNWLEARAEDLESWRSGHFGTGLKADKKKQPEPLDLPTTLRLLRQADDGSEKSPFSRASVRNRDDIGIFDDISDRPTSAWHFKGLLADGTIGHVIVAYREGTPKHDPAVRISFQRIDQRKKAVEWRMGSGLALKSVQAPRILPEERADTIEFIRRLRNKVRLPELYEYPQVPHEQWEFAHGQIHEFLRNLRP